MGHFPDCCPLLSDHLSRFCGYSQMHFPAAQNLSAIFRTSVSKYDSLILVSVIAYSVAPLLQIYGHKRWAELITTFAILASAMPTIVSAIQMLECHKCSFYKTRHGPNNWSEKWASLPIDGLSSGGRRCHMLPVVTCHMAALIHESNIMRSFIHGPDR